TILCLVISTSLAALLQQYVPPVPPGSPQLQNPRVFNGVSGQINNASPSNQFGQALPSTTVPVQQDAISLHNNQGQSSFGLQVTQNNQGPSPISLQDVTPLQNNQRQSSFGLQVTQNSQGPSSISIQDVTPLQNNQGQSSFGLQVTQNNQGPSPISLQEMTRIISEYDQNIQNGISNFNNVNNDVLGNGFASKSGNGNGQATINNIGFSNDLNNPNRVASNIEQSDQGTDNQGLPIIPNGSSSGIIGNNVNPNGNTNEFIVNDVAGVQHFSGGNNLNANSNAEFNVNTQALSSTQNIADSENNHFISGHSENSQNNGQLISHQNLHTHQNVNNNTHSGAVENSELNNKFDVNRSIQYDDNQRNVTDNAIMAKQMNKGNNRCGRGLVQNAHGTCVQPEVTRNVFVYAAPKMPHEGTNTSLEVPRPKIEYNLVFVRTPKGNSKGEPIIVPPPQQKTLVYVLSKNNDNGTQEIIEVPTGPKHDPEVYYVNYDEGDNPILPGGIELKNALSTTVQPGQTVNDAPIGNLLKDDIANDNIGSTANAASSTDNTIVNGIELIESAEGIIASTLTNNQNTEQTDNNYGNANNQNGHNSHVDVQIITGDRSDNGFISNDVGLNTADEIVQQIVGNFDGPLSNDNLRAPVSAINSSNGFNPGSVNFVTNGEGPNFREAPVGNINSDNGFNAGSANFVTNGEGPNFRQTLPTPQISYNRY
ncbi:unnamed protein product, partial [Meganyctiphanes norvegica]